MCDRMSNREVRRHEGIQRTKLLRARHGSIIVCFVVVGLVSACAKRHSDITGVYQFENGQLVTVSPSEKDTYRYRNLHTGESQRLYPSKGQQGLTFHSGPGWASEAPVELVVSFVADSSGSVTGLAWNDKEQPARYAKRVNLCEEHVAFAGGDIDLHGKLVLPAGPGPHPAIVIVHGSEKDAATEAYYEPYLYAAHGIAGFVYDKRGTGKSGGKFTMDFHKLAGDVVAAVNWLKQHNEIDAGRIGLAGYSQGGWIAPLAASQSQGVKFVLVGYGMAESPLQEDWWETLKAIQAKGYSDDDLEKAEEVISGVHAIILSDFSEGWRRLRELKRAYRGEPWVKELDVGMSGAFFKWPRWILTTVGRHFFPPELTWDYDPMPVLEQLELPMLWVLGAEDEEAPNQVTIRELERLKQQGKPIEMRIYPNADHGIIEFEVQEGERIYTGFPDDYFQFKVNWVRQQVGAE